MRHAGVERAPCVWKSARRIPRREFSIENSATRWSTGCPPTMPTAAMRSGCRNAWPGDPVYPLVRWLSLQRLPVPPAFVLCRLVGALGKRERSLVGGRGHAHRVVVDEKLPDIRVVGRTLRADLLGAKAVRLGIGVRIERRAPVAAIAGPETEARAFVRGSLLHHPRRDIRRLAARERRRGTAGEARDREIERAPEEMHRAHFPNVAR